MNNNNYSNIKNNDLNSKKAAINQEVKQTVDKVDPIQTGASKQEIRNQSQDTEGDSFNNQLLNKEIDLRNEGHQRGLNHNNQQGMSNFKEEQLRTAGIQGFNDKHEFISDQIDPKLTVNQLQTNEQVGLVSGMKTMVINQVPIVEKRDIVVGTQPKYEEQDVIIGNVPIIEKRDVVVGSKPVYGKKKVLVGQVPVVEKRDVVVGQRMVVEQQLNPEEVEKRTIVGEPVHQKHTHHHHHEHQQVQQTKTVVETVPVIKQVPVQTTVPVIKQVPVVKQVPVNQIPAGAIPLNTTNTTGSTMPRVVNPNTIPTTAAAPTTRTAPVSTIPTTAAAPRTATTQQSSVGLFKHGARLLLRSKHDKFLTADEDGKIKQSKDRGNAETWTVESLGGNIFGLRNALSGSFLSSDDKSLRLNSARAEEEKWRVEMLENGQYALSDFKGQYLHGGHFKHMSLHDSLTDNEKWYVESV